MSASTPDDQAKQAQAAADAAKAADEAAKLKAEVAKAEAEAAKLKAEARSADANARKTESEVTEWNAPAAQRQRSAETKKATAEADKAATDASRAQISALIPDLSDVDRGSLTVTPEKGLFGTSLAQRALDKAATSIATNVASALAGTSVKSVVLITTDEDLAASDAAYWEVTTGLKQLTEAADTALETLRQPVGPELLPAVIGALAAALPPVLSLFSAHRTLSTAPVTVSDIAASAAVAGKLLETNPECMVIHDNFRLLTSGQIQTSIETLSEKRQSLVSHKLTLEQTKAEQEAELAIRRDRIEDLTKSLIGADEKKTAELERQLDQARRERADAAKKAGEATASIGVIDTVLTAIDSFNASLVAVPAGAKWSPLTAATRRQQLHGDNAFTDALLIKASAGSTLEVVNDRPLWFDDKFSALAAISVTYLLLHRESNGLLAAGAATGTVNVTGTIGDRFNISTDN
jgi:hypothetical protein